MSPTSSRNSVPPLASSKRPIFCAMAPVNAPLLVSEELALEQAGRDRGAVQLDERPRSAAAQVVNRARDELFAGAGFALDEHGRVGGRDDLDLLEHVLQRRAVADDFLEVVLAANFVLEVQLFFVELFLQLGDLPVGEPVLDGNRDLLRDLTQQLDLVAAERIFSEPADVERAEDAIVRLERDAAERLHAFGEQVLRDLRLGRQGDEVVLAEHGGRLRRERDAAGRLRARVGTPLFDKALVLRHFQHMAPVLAGVGLVQHEAAAVVLNHLLQRRADRREHGVHVQVRDDGVVHFEEQAEAIALARELALHRTGALFVQNVVDGDRNLLGHFLHEGDLVVLIVMFVQAAESHGAQSAERSRQRYRAERLHAVLTQPRDHCGKPALQRDVVDDQRLLGLPDEAAGRLIDRKLTPGLMVESTGAASRCSRITLRAASCSTRLM